MMIKISVKEMVQFVYQSGDLQSELSLGRDQLGSDLHRKLQAGYHTDDQAEVYVKAVVQAAGETFEISGRMDGLRENATRVEEIKSTAKDLDEIELDTTPAHLAQAKIYAYMYVLEHPATSMGIDLVYISIDDEQTKVLSIDCSYDELERFFFDTLETFAVWMSARQAHRDHVIQMTKELQFPFTRRAAQDMFMKGIYQTLQQQGVLYAVAPTGTGKTMGALFSGLKAKGAEETLFYLTAKNSHKQLAMDSMAMLNNQGLSAISVELTAKDHVCFLEERDCDPKVCPFAKGYFDKIQGALQECLETTTHFTRPVIEEFAKAHEVCPFELSLDLSIYADVVVCDYNYVFDPKARLVRYFEMDRPVKLLIDEAHNLVSRSKSMYSATLSAEQLWPILEFKIPQKNKRSLLAVIHYLEKPSFDQPGLDPVITHLVNTAFDQLSDYLLTQAKHPNRKELLKGLFHLLDFRRITRLVNDTYHLIHDGDTQTLKLACLNAKEHLQESINSLRGTILFSATLEPLPYFQAFLTGDTGKVLRVDSPFDSSQVFGGVMNGIDVRYQTRAQSIEPISSVIQALQKTGKNTIVFAPSYSFIDQLKPHLPEQVILQTKDLSLEERDQIIQRFKDEQGMLGVFVVGGVFAEGVDYTGEMLEQVLIIGVGMPGIDLENNLTKNLFDQQGANGFDYAYKYPGVSKVIQAAGRLIRTETDRGVLLFIDTRYDQPFYQSMIPSFYGSLRTINDVKELQGHLNHFWAKNKSR